MIYNEDCLEGMKRLAVGSVDCIITDLPYNLTDCAWDKSTIDLSKFWAEVKRSAKKNAAIILFAKGKFSISLAMSNFKNYRYKICWEKPLATGHLNANKIPMQSHEDILIFYRMLPTYNPQFTKGAPRVYHSPLTIPSKCYHGKVSFDTVNDGTKCYPRDVVKFNVVQGHEPRYHPTQKPVALLEYLIKTYSNEGETVLDATMGSGSTGVACVNTGRKFIGFEKEQEFFEIAAKRIADAEREKSQQLFP